MRPVSLVLASLVACASPPSDGDVDDSADTGFGPDPADVPFVLDEVPLTPYVDAFIGTRGPGNVIPGALVPHGMVRASPDTLSRPGSIDAYDWSDTRIEGFTHTHLQGPGGSVNGYSQVLLLPLTGDVDVDRMARPRTYDHAEEEASPGLYRVTLEGGVEVALTATAHAAVHRYTFPAGRARLLVDLGHSNGDSVSGRLAIDGSVLSGTGEYNVHPIASFVTDGDGRTAYTRISAHVEVSLPPTEHGTLLGKAVTAYPGSTEAEGAWVGGWVGWDFDAPTTVEVRVGISRIDPAQARRNLESEVGTAGFDEVHDRARAAWEHVLNRVRVEADDDVLRMFYTALSRNFFQPADYTEAGGRFVVATSGEDVVKRARGFRYLTDDWCMWDTFRTTHPLATLVEPELRDDLASSLLLAYQEGGWLPKCSWNATGYSRVMIGNHAVPILADMLVKGLDRFDTALAWQAVDHAGMQDIPTVVDGAADGICGYVNLGTPPELLSLGFVPSECDPGQSVSMTLEHAYDDWSAGRMAAALGRQADADRYAQRGQAWRNTYNTDGFAQARRRDGSWREPFDPSAWGDFNDFTEATSWIYSWFVPHDVPGLVEVMGGRDAFLARLDRFFDEDQFDPGNEPSFHVPWLYAAVGDVDGTVRRLRETVASSYDDGPGGLPGNDDAGATSAWLVYTLLGLYPLAPGDPTYVVGAPLVRRAELFLHPGFHDGGSFVIEVEGDPATDRHVVGLTLDGEPLAEPWLPHARIVEGGTLVVTLAPDP
ncbi:MAG: glycoside hydrolase family 92 protein [Alphaproteobacteria bacterium]|nr:glycoside hydrolase family 92 protein [Alphaproteobacteria bacterium]